MSVASHITELKRKHEHLSTAVEAAQRRPAVDDLKKQKLKLKEEINRLTQ
jgi:hypothetical protein